MSQWTAVPIALVAALFFALSARWKHQSAALVPSAGTLRGAAVARLVRASLTHRLWLGGIAADAVGLGLQIVALHLGALSIVQCVLVSGLLFALILRRPPGGLSRADWGWAAVLVASLAGFLIVIGRSSTVVQERADRLSVILAACVGVAITLTCLAVARQRSARRSGVLLGIAVGTLYAASAALLKSGTNIVTDRGVPSAVFSWQALAVVLVGSAGLVLSQIAFQAGPLTASLPTIATTDPLLSVGIGLAVFEEQVRGGPVAMVALAGLLAAVGMAVFTLSRVDAGATTRVQRQERAAAVPA